MSEPLIEGSERRDLTSGASRMSTPDMATYLLVRYAEDAQAARAVIAERTAWRQIVELWKATRVPGVGEVDDGVHAGLGAAVQRLVQAYADRPDFPPEWVFGGTDS